MTLQYTLSKEDYVYYYTFMYWEATDRRKKRLKNALKQAIFFCLFSFVIFYSGIYGRINNISISVFILFFAAIFLPIITGRSQMVKQAEAITENPDNFSIFYESILTVTEMEIGVKNKIIDSKIKWSAIIKKIEIKDYYYLYLNAMQAIIIPKSAFKNNEEKLAFDKILSRNLSLEAELKDALN